MTDIKNPPSEIEIAQLLNNLSNEDKNVLRRLIFQRDRLFEQNFIMRKVAGEACHGFDETCIGFTGLKLMNVLKSIESGCL